MASVAEALDNMLEETESSGFLMARKSDRKIKSERNSLIKTLLRFLEDVDDEMTVKEVRGELEEI